MAPRELSSTVPSGRCSLTHGERTVFEHWRRVTRLAATPKSRPKIGWRCLKGRKRAGSVSAPRASNYGKSAMVAPLRGHSSCSWLRHSGGTSLGTGGAVKPWPGLSAVDAETDSPSLAVVCAGWRLLEAGGLRPCTARNRKAFVAGLKEDGILVPSGKPTAITDGEPPNWIVDRAVGVLLRRDVVERVGVHDCSSRNSLRRCRG